MIFLHLKYIKLTYQKIEYKKLILKYKYGMMS